MGNSVIPHINPQEFHVPCVLLVDNSGSMAGQGKIDELNQGLREFLKALQGNKLALGRVDVSVIAFNTKCETVVPFCPAVNYCPPVLKANGGTAMNEAIMLGLNAIEDMKGRYASASTPYFRPWLFLMTDGVPTDGDKEGAAKQALKTALDNKKVIFFPMGVGKDADIKHLKTYTKDGTGYVLKAEETYFKEAFVWLSNSVGDVSVSQPGLDSIRLRPTPAHIDML